MDAVSPAVELRRISDDEWELWRDVRLRALADAPLAFGSSLEYWQAEGEERWRSRLRDVPLNVVAVDADGGLGQVSGQREADGRVELISMWLAPSARGTGVGEALIAEVVDWATAQGAEAVVLSVKETNAPALSLYRRLGFRPTKEAADPGEIRMQRSVGPR